MRSNGLRAQSQLIALPSHIDGRDSGRVVGNPEVGRKQGSGNRRQISNGKSASVELFKVLSHLAGKRAIRTTDRNWYLGQTPECRSMD
jgi:hypothetical protein